MLLFNLWHWFLAARGQTLREFLQIKLNPKLKNVHYLHLSKEIPFQKGNCKRKPISNFRNWELFGDAVAFIQETWTWRVHLGRRRTGQDIRTQWITFLSPPSSPLHLRRPTISPPCLITHIITNIFIYSIQKFIFFYFIYILAIIIFNKYIYKLNYKLIINIKLILK